MAPQMIMPASTHRVIQDCAMMCIRTHHTLLQNPDTHMRVQQLKLLSDCADICETCAKFMNRQSALMKSVCEYCAYVCEICGRECLRHPDQGSQLCGQMCLNCARECRAVAMQMGGN